MYKNASRNMQSHLMRGVKFRRYRSSPPPAARVAPSIEWPAYVTSGREPDGSLRVLVFNSRQDADNAGYQWVNRPASDPIVTASERQRSQSDKPQS